VRRKTGLYSEIIFTMAVVVGAALLLGGFLLLKLTETELLGQRVEYTRQMAMFVARAASTPNAAPKAPPNFTMIKAMLEDIGPEVDSWDIYDRYGNRMTPRKKPSPVLTSPDKALVQEVTYYSQTVHRVDYKREWIPVVSPASGLVTVATPLRSSTAGNGVLLVRFSLSEIGQQINAARNMMLLYVVLYGAVLTGFGVVLLGRAVIKPVRQLREATSRVTDGDLSTNVAAHGPGEIADLANSFNAMTDALQKGREDLIRSERMASVGHLSAGMAHEIGNPLGAVLGYLELLKSELEPGRSKEIVEKSLIEINRIDHLVKELLDYAAPTGEQQEIVDPADVLRESVDIASHQKAFAEIEFSVDSPARIGLVRIDPHKLMQVMINLMVNAKDCLEDSNTIYLAATRQGQFAEIVVRDEGCGIPDDVLPHIFDPFFTSKPQGKGRGLGLAICQRIITEAGGKIVARSPKDMGTTFTILLPIERDG